MTLFSRVNHVTHVEAVTIPAYEAKGHYDLVLPASPSNCAKSQWQWRITFRVNKIEFQSWKSVQAFCTVEDKSDLNSKRPIHWGIKLRVREDDSRSSDGSLDTMVRLLGRRLKDDSRSSYGSLDTMVRLLGRPYGLLKFNYSDEFPRSLELAYELQASENGNFAGEPSPSEDACAISELVQSLGSLLTSGLLSDVKLRTKEGDVAAHRSILAARSDFFKSKFKPEWQGVDAIVVDVSDVSLPVLKAMLRYIYTGSYGDDNVDIIKLLVAADMYLVTDLCNKIKKELEKSLESGKPIAPVCDLLKISATYNSTSLRAVVLKYMKKHPQLLKSKEWFAFHKANRLMAAEAALDMINLPD